MLGNSKKLVKVHHWYPWLAFIGEFSCNLTLIIFCVWHGMSVVSFSTCSTEVIVTPFTSSNTPFFNLCKQANIYAVILPQSEIDKIELFLFNNFSEVLGLSS